MNAPACVSVREPAVPHSVGVIRRTLRGFLAEMARDQLWQDDVLTAVGEAVANAVEHAYGCGIPGEVVLSAHVRDDGALFVEVCDSGSFIRRPRTEGRGHGLIIMQAIAQSVAIDTQGGTRIRLTFE